MEFKIIHFLKSPKKSKIYIASDKHIKIKIIPFRFFSTLLNELPILIKIPYKPFKICFVKLNKQNEKKSSICYELYKKKNKNLNKLWFEIFVFISVNSIMNKFIDTKTKNIVSASLLILFVLVSINKIILNYRFKNGYFGTNYLEAKELIYYIKNSKNNTHKGKKIFDESIKPSLLLNADDKTKIGEGV